MENAVHDMRVAKASMEIQEKRIREILRIVDASIDVSQYSRSWAVISIQGRQDFIKFIDLGERDLKEIKDFLRNFDRTKVDASPQIIGFFK